VSLRWLVEAGWFAALLYQLAVIAAALVHRKRRDPPLGSAPFVSVLKPLHGPDPHGEQALRSHLQQDYPAYEVLFGLRSLQSSFRNWLEGFVRSYGLGRVRLILAEPSLANQKVGVLAELARHARGEIFVVNDSDIEVHQGYLREVVAPLGDPTVGLVTCLYRGMSDHFPGKFEALGIATDFAPGVLVAPFVGVREFGLGATLAFRRETLERIGGFEAIGDYLADDYQLARRIRQAGYRIHLSRTVVTTWLGGQSWREVWRHQLRWHRTIRACKGLGYAGLVVTQATFWSIVAAWAGQWFAAALLLTVRVLAGLTVGLGVLECSITRRYWYLMPLRDLFGMLVWLGGWLVKRVEWRGEELAIDSEGRILGRIPLAARVNPEARNR